jgi:trehalose 6-phosphate phosphatase
MTTSISTNSSVAAQSSVKQYDRENLAAAFPFNTHAILLDIDGTILDLAATPTGVQMPSNLQSVLTTLWKCTGGALALVSGRPLDDIDSIFAPLELPAIGGHGAELRPEASTGNILRPAPLLEERVRRHLMELMSKGMIAEDKGHSMALHYRGAPERGDELLAGVQRLIAGKLGSTYEALPGKFVIEIKPTGFNKGTAVLELMDMPPFKGRVPIFIGDDVTDESVFAILPNLKGIGFSVGRLFPGVTSVFRYPEEVRDWLSRIAAQASDK